MKYIGYVCIETCRRKTKIEEYIDMKHIGNRGILSFWATTHTRPL